MGAVVEIWFESLNPFLLKDSHIVQWQRRQILAANNVPLEREGLETKEHKIVCVCVKAPFEKAQNTLTPTVQPLVAVFQSRRF